MEIHCYHLLLIKRMIRKKKKGDHHIPLTYLDRQELIAKDGVQISESYIHKVLSESPKARCSFSQHTMNELCRYLGFRDYNDFLKNHPSPLPYLGRARGKRKKEVLRAVEEVLG